MKELKELEDHIETCDKYTRDLTKTVLVLLGRQMIHERKKVERITETKDFFYDKWLSHNVRITQFKNKPLFKRIILAIKKEI